MWRGRVLIKNGAYVRKKKKRHETPRGEDGKRETKCFEEGQSMAGRQESSESGHSLNMPSAVGIFPSITKMISIVHP